MTWWRGRSIGGVVLELPDVIVLAGCLAFVARHAWQKRAGAPAKLALPVQHNLQAAAASPWRKAVLFGVIYFVVRFLYADVIVQRWDPMCGDAGAGSHDRRCYFRKKAYFEKGYYQQQIAQGKDRPFSVVEVVGKSTTKIVSFCLWGDAESRSDVFNALKGNAEYMRDMMPGWTARLYIHEGIGQEHRKIISGYGYQLYVMHDDSVAGSGGSAGMFWRMLPLIEDVDCIVLDTDEPMERRGVHKIVAKFFDESNPSLLRTAWSFPWPATHTMGGLIYKKRQLKLPLTQEMIVQHPWRRDFGADEVFLTNNVGELMSTFPNERTTFNDGPKQTFHMAVVRANINANEASARAYPWSPGQTNLVKVTELN